MDLVFLNVDLLKLILKDLEKILNLYIAYKQFRNNKNLKLLFAERLFFKSNFVEYFEYPNLIWNEKHYNFPPNLKKIVLKNGLEICCPNFSELNPEILKIIKSL